jgi:hypothetical protein
MAQPEELSMDKNFNGVRHLSDTRGKENRAHAGLDCREQLGLWTLRMGKVSDGCLTPQLSYYSGQIDVLPHSSQRK